jgi:hypothetical protein
MEKDSFELDTGPTAETEHCANTAQIATETTSPPLQALPGGYDASRFNALRHGVLSVHTVLPWEDKAEYEALLNALVKEHVPHGPTEEHLVEEIAGVFWRKRRLRLAEAGSYRRGLQEIGGPSREALETALIKVEPIINHLTETPLRIAGDFPDLKRSEASARNALEILSKGKAGAYDAALAELDESTRRSWEDQIAPEGEDSYEDEDPDGDLEPYTADATGLVEYLEWLLPQLAKHLEYDENRHLIREQVLSEAFPWEQLQRLSRYEVHLDRKLKDMLVMLLRLQSLRQSNEAS